MSEIHLYPTEWRVHERAGVCVFKGESGVAATTGYIVIKHIQGYLAHKKPRTPRTLQ